MEAFRHWKVSCLCFDVSGVVSAGGLLGGFWRRSRIRFLGSLQENLNLRNPLLKEGILG
jgi:hypothetical protein